MGILHGGFGDYFDGYCSSVSWKSASYCVQWESCRHRMWVQSCQVWSRICVRFETFCFAVITVTLTFRDDIIIWYIDHWNVLKVITLIHCQYFLVYNIKFIDGEKRDCFVFSNFLIFWILFWIEFFICLFHDSSFSLLHAQNPKELHYRLMNINLLTSCSEQLTAWYFCVFAKRHQNVRHQNVFYLELSRSIWKTYFNFKPAAIYTWY